MPINGGGGSSFKKSTEDSPKGPIKTILMGKIIVDTVLFQATGESEPVLRIESGYLGKPRGPVDPKSEVVIKLKASPKTMKRITNFFLEMFMGIQTTLNSYSWSNSVSSSGSTLINGFGVPSS